jgi:hypothetical protein
MVEANILPPVSPRKPLSGAGLRQHVVARIAAENLLGM